MWWNCSKAWSKPVSATSPSETMIAHRQQAAGQRVHGQPVQRPFAGPDEHADGVCHNVDDRYLLEMVDEHEDALDVMQVLRLPVVEQRDLAVALHHLDGDVLSSPLLK